ncbi:ecdysone oxidase-like [Nymphalis io]|uniref:ecdysone oxidase-like n=1 Tax=Inachis io TaxID=171585 RepID=UPI002166C641|nr:ecdysone oxidase-like [Nymphalis io]XP_050353332.1 ecdysone oxidase-like [Nymphalis io]XP_050353333.1 ecdysone oxidase-like [Nymphalis io]
MDVGTALAGVRTIKSAFLVLVALALTGYKWPVHKPLNDSVTCDYIVVGAGTAGSIVANRLSEDPRLAVCVIEAGGDPPLETEIPSLFAYLPKTYMDWNFTSEDDGYTAQYRQQTFLDLPQGKLLGGSSSIHHLYHIRGDPKDYDDWATATGDDSWSWQNLLPYFIKSERVEDPYILNSQSGKYHGSNGYMGITRESRDLPLRYLKAFKEMGHKIIENANAGETLGFFRPMITIFGGVRQSSAESFLSPIKNRENLYIMKNTLVTKILIDENSQATGVQCTTSDGTAITILAQREVIVSAGAFNTPKLLMLSGIGPKDHLESFGISVVSDLPVGENLQDHMGVILVHKLEETSEILTSDPTQFPVPTFVGFGAINKTQSNPDYITLNLISRNIPAVLMQLCSSVFSLHEDVCAEIYSTGEGREVLFTVLSLGRPSSRGQIRLQSANPEDPPKIYTGFLSAIIDLEKNVDSILDFIRVTESSYFTGVGGQTKYFDFPNCREATTAREYWKCYVLHMMDTTFHYSATCPMGTVLDSSLKVVGVSKLRVVDASALPNLTSGTINAAVMVLAEKAADIIKRSQSCE